MGRNRAHFDNQGHVDTRHRTLKKKLVKTQQFHQKTKIRAIDSQTSSHSCSILKRKKKQTQEIELVWFKEHQ